MGKSGKLNVKHPSEKDGKNSSFLATWSFPIICFAAIFLSPVIMGAVSSQKVHSNDVKQWLPKNFEASKDYDWFIERFGVDEMIVVSWDDCKLGDERVHEFRVFLEREKTDNGEPVFDRIVTADSMVNRIEAVGISPRVARDRIRGLLIGPDDETTCVLAFPSSSITMGRTQMVQTVYEMAEREFGFQPDDLKLAGPTVDGAAIDVESRKALNSFMWITVVIVFFLSWYRLKDFIISLTVLGFSVACAFLSLSILYWSGGTMNLTMIMLPTLTFILGVSASIHMANYYRKAASEGAGWRAADQALKAGALPVALSSITTAIGLASLGASQVTPIRMFGIYSAIGIVASLPIILLLMPAVLFQFRGRISRRSAGDHLDKRQRETGVSTTMSRMVYMVCKYHWFASVPALVALLLLSFGISYLKGSVKLQNRFAKRTKIIQDYQWLEENLGPLVPLEIVISFDKKNRLQSWEQMLLIEKIEKDLLADELGSASLSAATFKPKFQSKNAFAKFQRRIGIQKWQSEEENLIAAKLIQFDNRDRLWRISLRVNALNDLDYGDLLDSVESRVRAKISEFESVKNFEAAHVSARFTGGIPLFYHAQHQILSDLKNSFVTAFLFISVVLMIVLSSFRAGLVAMIPNVFPPLFVFGAMGWLGLPIEIGSVMTASVALGIAVDDTIHFLTWYRRGVKDDRSRMNAIRFAFDHCAKPMIDTTLICGFGVAAFMFTDFMPTVRFSRLLFILLMAALIGDLFLLPAILAGPLGKLFRQRVKKGEHKSSDDSNAGDGQRVVA